MDIPLPKVVSDVGPGGPLVTAMRGMNALQNDWYENQIKAVQARYAPLAAQADAASKLAYANLMGPQFLAKLMGHTDVLANMTDKQKMNALDILYRSGTGQGTGNALLNPQMISPAQNSNSLSSWAVNKLKGLLGNDQLPQSDSQSLPSSSTNAFLQNNPGLSPQDQNAIANMKPGQSYVVQGNQSPLQETQITPSQNSFAENVGTYKGIIEEGQASGKNRAEDIKMLNDHVFNGQTNQATLDTLSDILASPEFEKIRQVPLAGHHELRYYSKFGTPKQQEMVGQYYTLTGNIIKDSARDFQGMFRKGEQQLLMSMKPSDSDTVDTARGKTESLSVMNRLLMERAKLTSQIMTKQHINKLQAEEIADKQINGDEIRRQVHDRLHPTITIRNKKTGETKTVPISEARKLGVSNV